MGQVGGNRSVQRMLVQPTATHIQRKTEAGIIQRALSEDQEKFWTDHNGDQLCDNLAGRTGAWASFRQSPASFSQLSDTHPEPGQMADLLAAAEPAIRQHAALKLGSAIRYLTEMAAFREEYRLLVGVLPGKRVEGDLPQFI